MHFVRSPLTFNSPGRFRQYSTKLNMDSTLKSMLISDSSYKSIQNYVRNKGMNISNSTICRMKKSVKA